MIYEQNTSFLSFCAFFYPLLPYILEVLASNPAVFHVVSNTELDIKIYLTQGGITERFYHPSNL